MYHQYINTKLTVGQFCEMQSVRPCCPHEAHLCQPAPRSCPKPRDGHSASLHQTQTSAPPPRPVSWCCPSPARFLVLPPPPGPSPCAAPPPSARLLVLRVLTVSQLLLPLVSAELLLPQVPCRGVFLLPVISDALTGHGQQVKALNENNHRRRVQVLPRDLQHQLTCGGSGGGVSAPAYLRGGGGSERWDGDRHQVRGQGAARPMR